jgi:IrrE N-terminal-like domain
LHNRFLDQRTGNDIDRRIAKILKDLGNPEPPLRLELVRELLRLDRAYYSSSDGSALAETVHRLMVAGKQVMQRPGLLIDAVIKLDIKALWIPDRKRILIDKDLPSAKQRWGEAHEIGHSILPWHDVVMHGDKKRTLSLACEQQVESEANFAAGRLLFLQEQFTDRLRSNPLSFDSVKLLSKAFGNTMTSTLWRVVEASEAPVFGLVGQHPNHPLGEQPIRYFVRSPSFEARFGEVAAMDLFRMLQGFCFGNRGPVGNSEIVLTAASGDDHIFFVECFFNAHEALSLGVYRRARVVAVGGPIRPMRV